MAPRRLSGPGLGDPGAGGVRSLSVRRRAGLVRGLRRFPSPIGRLRGRRSEREETRRWVAEPPVALPPGRVVHVPGRGEFFLRDTGGDGIPVLLLHGWMFHADLNWFRVYEPLARAGYRVLAMDHRGHGRGLRTLDAFRLVDCAGDAAALVRALETGPVLVVGYSMGGAIAQLLARDHPTEVAGLVLCATSNEWRRLPERLFWRGMAGVRLTLGLFPHESWRTGLRLGGFPRGPITTWTAAELTRGSGRDMADAGRDLGRFDSRPWAATLTPPAAVVVTARDRSVPPRKQRALAASVRAPVFEVAGDHAAVTMKHRQFTGALLRALAAVRTAAGEDTAAEPQGLRAAAGG